MLGDQIPHPQEGKSGQMPEVYAQEKGEGGGGVEASILPVHYWLNKNLCPQPAFTQA